jgi:hypothetical protein
MSWIALKTTGNKGVRQLNKWDTVTLSLTFNLLRISGACVVRVDLLRSSALV